MTVSESPVEVTCPAGTIIGVADEDVARFHSIAYSRIPAPFSDAEPAPQGMLIDATVERPDDIALSITTPLGAKDVDDLPVIVHVHGGRFEMGDHTDPAAPGDALARQGVILVKVGYRLMLEGLAQFHDDPPAHFRAVNDVATALTWVQRNIEAFGGDPTNVTLSGQSAGAAVVLWLMRKDHYKGEFRRALALSPAFPRLSYNQRKSVIRAGAGIPLTRKALNDAAATRSGQKKIRRGYSAVRRRYFTDMALGPAPLDPAEMAEVDLVISSLSEEMYEAAAKRDRANMARFDMILPGFIMGLKPDHYVRFFKVLKARNPKHILGEFFSANLIRRWVDMISLNAPGRVWQAELVGDGVVKPYHCADLAPLFAGEGYAQGEGLNAWLVTYARTGEPGWEPYSDHHNALRVDLSGKNPELVREPLAYLREAFSLKWD
ncbi:carboxylesterase family protein [Corynebacterium aquatimens]|uniref:Carboxylic ester hydrolase n=1 Tax=Corynebacterium aquatimens TaxID=1190508 RepID=A0A931E1U4_9CORY|nr:carboxylesterase family protein [Corynebacterium aquatimens]MBG6122095.1 acetyl esterase/lipase [Corynebacterium aquatimens]WJY65364.1 Carboxylesterase [Corynebacterium aquatimens]